MGMKRFIERTLNEPLNQKDYGVAEALNLKQNKISQWKGHGSSYPHEAQSFKFSTLKQARLASGLSLTAFYKIFEEEF